jgi:sugar phosphate isomerase/epimerase
MAGEDERLRVGAARTVNTPPLGVSLAGSYTYARAVDAYRDLGAVAARAGVVLTLDVHMNTIHDTAASAARLLDRIDMPDVRANYDPGNMFGTRSAEPALEAIAILGARIAYVHVKNARRVSYLLVGIDYHFDLAGGDLDYSQIVQELHQTGFRGPYDIEYAGAGDRSMASRHDVAYLRSLLAAVASEDVHATAATTYQEPV